MELLLLIAKDYQM
jgi:hypothetical protein